MSLLPIFLSNSQLLVAKRFTTPNKFNQHRIKNLQAIFNNTNQLEGLKVFKTKIFNKIVR